ncbi:MAG: ribosome-binding factor A [Patescibacteria group bacterium]
MIERDIEALREAAAEFISREANRNSLITVTRASLTDDRKRGVVYLTVYPEDAEESAVAFANRNRAEFGKFFETRVRGMRIPHIEFMIDRGEKNRQRLDELTK